LPGLLEASPALKLLLASLPLLALIVTNGDTFLDKKGMSLHSYGAYEALCSQKKQQKSGLFEASVFEAAL
jgi:hypothetical protein